MLGIKTGNFEFVLPSAEGQSLANNTIFGIGALPTNKSKCRNSVGGTSGTKYKENSPWKADCKMFRDN